MFSHSLKKFLVKSEGSDFRRADPLQILMSLANDLIYANNFIRLFFLRIPKIQNPKIFAPTFATRPKSPPFVKCPNFFAPPKLEESKVYPKNTYKSNVPNRMD